MTTIPRTSGIYQILCVPTGKVYIGSAVNLRKRKNDHWAYLRTGNHHNAYLQHAWNKYGEQAFEFSVIELVLSSFILEREQYWLDKTKVYDHKKGFNFSPTAGSPLGVKRSEETREKIRKFTTGVVQSSETVEKRAAALRGRKRTSEVVERAAAGRRRSYYAVSPEGQEILVVNLKVFCAANALNYETMQMVVRGTRNHHKGWKCRLA